MGNEMNFLILWGIVGHLIMLGILKFPLPRNFLSLRERKRVKGWLSQAGEAGDGGGKGSDGGKDGDKGGRTFTQDEVNAVVARERKEFKEKYKDYDDLKNEVQTFRSQDNDKKQKELEEAKKYDEAKKGYEAKISDLNNLIKQKDQTITDKDISFSLTNEISKQGGYVEEALSLLKGQIFSNNGSIKIKMKDSNGIDQELSVEEGVKKFLETRPYLVRANFKPGSGSSGNASAGGDIGGGSVNDDLNVLNEKFQVAMKSGDFKAMKELRGKIQDTLSRQKRTIKV